MMTDASAFGNEKYVILHRCERLVDRRWEVAMNDKELLALLRDDPEQGLAVVIDEYAGLVKAVVRRLLSGVTELDVDECISDVFVRLYRGAGRFDPAAGSFKGYLCGIARHTALDYRRRAGKTAGMLSTEENEIGVEFDPVDKLAREANRQIVHSTVSDMGSPDKEIFIMRYFFGERVSVIAEKLNISHKAVENKLYRGKKKLKAELIERGIIL